MAWRYLPTLAEVITNFAKRMCASTQSSQLQPRYELRRFAFPLDIHVSTDPSGGMALTVFVAHGSEKRVNTNHIRVYEG